MARLAGAVSAAILAILLLWTAFATFFGDDNVVLPTGRVSHYGPVDNVPAGPTAAQVLTERTRLQGWRGQSGPAPGESADTTGRPALLAGEHDTLADPREIFREWVLSRGWRRSWSAARASLKVWSPIPIRPAGSWSSRVGETGGGSTNEEVTYGS